VCLHTHVYIVEEAFNSGVADYIGLLANPLLR
jgi:hypothetical protein